MWQKYTLSRVHVIFISAAVAEGGVFMSGVIGLSYERPYLVLDLNLISNLHVTQQITLVNWQIL